MGEAEVEDGEMAVALRVGDGSSWLDTDADVALGVSGASGGAGWLLDYAPPPFDVRRVEWEDERVFGLEPLKHPTPSGHLAKRRMLIQLAQSRTLDSCCAVISHLIDLLSPALTTSNYTQLTLTLFTAAGFGSSPWHGISAEDSAEVADACWSIMATARRRRWLLPTRAYNCALYMLCTLDDERCHTLHRLMTSLDDLILTEQSYAPYVAYLHRHRRYRELLRVWKEWLARFEVQRVKWDVSVGQLLGEWILDDDKQKEVASLATHLPCQQLWMFNAALHAANQTRQTHTAMRLLQQMHEWRWRYQQLTAASATPTSSIPDWHEERLFDHVGCLGLLVEPRWSASTFFHLLTLASRRAAWTQLILTLGSMRRAHLLHPLHQSTLLLLTRLAVSTRRWKDIRAIVDCLRHPGDAQFDLDTLLGATQRICKAANGQPQPSPLHRQAKRLLLHSLQHLQQQQLISIHRSPSTDALTVVVHLHRPALHSRTSQSALLDILHSVLLLSVSSTTPMAQQLRQREQIHPPTSLPPSAPQRPGPSSSTARRHRPSLPFLCLACRSARASCDADADACDGDVVRMCLCSELRDRVWPCGGDGGRAGPAVPASGTRDCGLSFADPRRRR